MYIQLPCRAYPATVPLDLLKGGSQGSIFFLVWMRGHSGLVTSNQWLAWISSDLLFCCASSPSAARLFVGWQSVHLFLGCDGVYVTNCVDLKSTMLSLFGSLLACFRLDFVLACTMIIVYACTMSMVHAYTMIIVFACTKNIVHTCTMIIIVHALLWS